MDKEIFYALIQEHNASETLVRTGTVDQFDIDKEEAVDLYTHGLQLPEAYVCTLLESRGGPQIFSGIMNLSLKKRKIFNQLLANADPDNGYAISNEVILEFGRDQEIQQTMTDCDIDMNRFGNYDDSIEFEILDTTNFFALGLKAPLTQLSTDFETTYKMISKSLKKADPQTVERLGYYDKEKEKNISGTIVLERVRGAFATMKLWTSDAQKKIDTLHKKYQEAEKNAIGDGDGLADGAADLEAQDAIAAIQREGLECIRNFLKNLSNMSHRIGIQKKSMRSLQKEGFDFDFPQLDTNLQHIESAQSGINDVLVSSKHEYDENKGISETDAPLKTRKMKLHFAQKNLTNWFLIGEDTNCCVTFEHLLDYLLDIGVKLPVTEDMESGKRPYTSFFWAGESSVDDTAAGVMDNIEGHPLFASFHRGVIRNKYFEFITNFCSAVGIDRTVLGNGFNDVQTSDLSILCEDIAGGKVKPTFQKIGGDVFGTDPSNAYPLRHLFLEARDNPVYELPQVS